VGRSKGEYFMMEGTTNWVFNQKNLISAHASQYKTALDACGEIIKNHVQAGAKTIWIELLNKRKTILIYGDGKGMDVAVMNQVMTNAADSIAQNKLTKNSMKTEANHGVGLFSIFRFSAGMWIFSKSINRISVLSCHVEEHSKNIITATGGGGAREVNEDDRDYEEFYNKLNKFSMDGTLNVIEGVGENISPHYDWNVKMKEDFDPKKVTDYIRENYSHLIGTDSIVFKLKADEAKPISIEAKTGVGPKKEFFIPSKSFPEKSLPGKAKVHGRGKDCFMRNGFIYKLNVYYLFHFSDRNDGMIRIGAKNESFIPIRSITSNKIPSFYRNSDLTRYLTGIIIFKLDSLDGGPAINVYTGNRDTLLLNDDFGDCLANNLQLAAVEVLQLEAQKKANALNNKGKEKRELLQKGFEELYHSSEFQALMKEHELAGPLSTSPVHDNTVTCSDCGTKSIPKRGDLLKDIRGRHDDSIFAPKDVDLYYCGKCGNFWKRRKQEGESSGPSDGVKPVASKPEDGVERKKRHGFYYIVDAIPFTADNKQVAILKGEDVVLINTTHPDYVL
jgi:Histidine kinase-, DNA gyrase B-, and HSP90-like ATPase